MVVQLHEPRFQQAAGQSAYRLTNLLTRLAGTGETTRDTGDAHRGLRLVSETRRITRDVGDARRMAYNPEMYSRKRATIAPSSSTRERAGSPARRRCCQRRGAYSGAQAVLILVMVYRSPGPYVPLRIAASCLVLRLFVPYIAARGIAEIEQLLSNHY